MRVFYLLVIFALILFMTFQFDAFGRHYDYLLNMANKNFMELKYLETRCDCRPR
jgi:hypothetical protein